MGLQEPLSVLFSLLNGYPHLIWFVSPSKRQKFAPENDHPVYRKVLLFSSIVGINTWWWSAVFHARDNWWTERLDYHFATVHMATYFLLAVVRLALLINPRRVTDTLMVTFVALLLWIARHVWWLNMIHFDYGYNMLVTGIVVAMQVVAWLVWAILARRKGAPHWKMICKFQACLLSFALLETFDFPPVWGWLDAHACWHGLTVGLVFYWYQFLQEDAKWRKKEANVV